MRGWELDSGLELRDECLKRRLVLVVVLARVLGVVGLGEALTRRRFVLIVRAVFGGGLLFWRFGRFNRKPLAFVEKAVR